MVYRKALKLEANKRAIKFVDPVSEEDDPDAEDSTHEDPFKTKINATN
jgi:hypothetical protein